MSFLSNALKAVTGRPRPGLKWLQGAGNIASTLPLLAELQEHQETAAQRRRARNDELWDKNLLARFEREKEKSPPEVKSEACQRLLNYRFKNESLIIAALNLTTTAGNRSMAIIGDSVVQLLLVQYWYESGTKRSLVGDFMENSSNISLYRVGEKHQLDMYSDRVPKYGVYRLGHNGMGTLVEAIIGAVYLDGGLVEASFAMQELDMFSPK